MFKIMVELIKHLYKHGNTRSPLFTTLSLDCSSKTILRVYLVSCIINFVGSLLSLVILL